MPVVFQQSTTDTAGRARLLALDITSGTYTLQIDGVNVTAAPAQPADTRLVTLTAGANVTLPAQDVGKVGFAGPALVASGAPLPAQSALGRLAAVAINGGATQTAVFGVGGG